MPPIRRQHTGTAPQTTLTGAGLAAGALSFTVTDGTGYPTGSPGPFVITIEAGGSAEERVLCDSRSGNTFTVNALGRGYDGTANVTHAVGKSVNHTFSALEADEANAHVVATTGVHGVTGAVAGITDTQALTNKDLTSATNTFPSTNPRGSLGYIERSSSQSGIGTGATTITTFSVTATVAAGRKIRVTAHLGALGAAGLVVAGVLLLDGVTGLQQKQRTLANAASVEELTLMAVHTPAAGSHTWTVQMFVSSSTFAFSASAGAPNFLLVEDIGV